MSNKEKILPKYTLGEELCNSITHGIGALLSVAALVLCIVRSVYSGNVLAIVSSCIYGASSIILYSNSTVYHALKRNLAKVVMRKIDHCSIFLLIAGTYTPLTLVSLNKVSLAWGWSLFGLVWAFAILGIVLNAISVDKFKKFSMVAYIGMGWIVVIAFKPLIEVINGTALVLLIAGGVAYTVGSVLYGIGSKHKYIHSVFHVFVLAGSILHFFLIYSFVLK